MEDAFTILYVADHMREISGLSSSSIVAMTNGIPFEYSSPALWSVSVCVSLSVSFSVCLSCTLSAGSTVNLSHVFTLVLFFIVLLINGGLIGLSHVFTLVLFFIVLLINGGLIGLSSTLKNSCHCCLKDKDR